jgi:ATP-dependent RNA helicase CshB
MTFDGYEIKDYIAKALLDLNFKYFTEVQHEVFKNIKKNKNILVKSKTGSGKTHSFLVPIFNSLDESKKECQALIISPTKELAQQTYKACQHIASFFGGEINIKLYSGGTDREREIELLKKSQPQIAIATPGKVKDLVIDSNALKIYTAKYYVIDEVDMALDNGFKDEIDSISEVLKDARKMFFSATISESILPFVKKYLENPIFIDLKNNQELSIVHYWIPIKYKEKIQILDELMDILNPYICIIFCNKKETVQEVYNHLSNNGIKAGIIHGGMQPRERRHFLRECEDLKYQYIVASDLASRGIDIDGVSHIINYDIPRDFEFYLHRSGRTGRMNYTGEVYSFYTTVDNEYLDNLKNHGIEPVYKELKHGEIKDFKGRDARKERFKPRNEVERSAYKHVKKPTKVTPGYKKKMAKEAEEIAKHLYKNINYKKRFKK